MNKNNKNDFKELKQVAGLSSKPFYLKKPKDSIRALIVTSLILLVLGVANKYLFLVLAMYLLWAFTQFKKYKSEANILLGDAIGYYEFEQNEKCLEVLNKVLELEPKNEKARIISALIKYDNDEFNEVIELLSYVSEKIINNDLDLQIKLADCYVQVGKSDNAKGLYEKLSKITGKSSFIENAMKNLE